MKPLCIVSIILILSCKDHHANRVVNRKAFDFNLKATQIYMRNSVNIDSINYAIKLLDSAIHFDTLALSYYFNKYELSMRLKKCDLALKACDGILSINANNFLGILSKGVAFDMSQQSDSAITWYRKALDALDKTKFKPSFFGEYERITLYGLLKDTSNFDISLVKFKDRFKDERDFPAIYDKLTHFERSEFINSY